MAYIYQADVWCDACGERICAELDAEGRRPAEPDDQHTYDSDDYPKQFDAESDEADGPQNCASGNCAGTYGTFLQNPLTQHGYEHLQGMLNEHGSVLPEPAREWADHYGFSFHANPWDGPQDWLRDVIQGHAAETQGPGAAPLVSILDSVLSLLDADQIQDTFQQEMDDDGYFRAEGWYSSEME